LDRWITRLASALSGNGQTPSASVLVAAPPWFTGHAEIARAGSTTAVERSASDP